MADNPYTSQTLSNYNANPPPDDGTTVAANQLTWAKHKDKLGDPLKNFSTAIDAAALAAGVLTVVNGAEQTNTLAGSIGFTISTLTTATGEIVPTRTSHAVGSEGGAGTDNVDVISATGVATGTWLDLVASATGEVITVRSSATGNIELDNANDVVLDISQPLGIWFDGTNWRERYRPVGKIQNIDGPLTVAGVITGSTLEATGAVSAGDAAAVGSSATSGLELTGQGSSFDLVLLNDLAQIALAIPTGTDEIVLPGSLSVDGTTESTSATTGSIHTDGGVGIAKALFVAGIGDFSTAGLAMPAAFAAYPTATLSNVTGNNTLFTVTFGTERFDIGSDFVGATGIFTAPVTGKYLFTLSLRVTGFVAASSVEVLLVTSNFTWEFVNTAEVDGAEVIYSHSIVADLDAADTARVQIRVNGEGADIIDIAGTAGRSSFSGAFIST